ncbi:MAG: hypothetical protein V5783_02135 [Pontiella sp.]
MYKSKSILPLLVLTLFFQSLESWAQYVIHEGTEDGEIRNRTVVVPYAFSSETLGFGIGLGGSYGPDAQPQTTYYGTVYGTDNDSWLFLLGGYNIQIPGIERLSFRPYASMARQTKKRLYIPGNPDYPDERAGSNESSSENYMERDAYELTIDLPIRYTLPWGHFKESGVHTYITQNGILKENPSGGTSLNPLESGQSVVLFRTYYRNVFNDDQHGESLFFEFAYEHDNRDFIPNPHRGYKIKMGAQYDPDWFQNTREWTALYGEINGFIPLPQTDWCQQQTIALSAWSSYAPTYDPQSDNLNGKPFYFAGPTLGGLWRMRGYPAYRFHDKAAIYYSAEYRVMPEWQPFGAIDFLDPLMIRWWQIVGIVEFGRVAPSWNLETLHTDMKYDVGIGIRGMFDSGIGRLDLVVSEEGVSFIAMFGQAF